MNFIVWCSRWVVWVRPSRLSALVLRLWEVCWYRQEVSSNTDIASLLHIASNNCNWR
ncbi:hypothetical protein M758_5G063400 [Ceratodon purpureus]|uniref:Uncharacterized protein n=1 Tax=Ceratodon purpureus TaxID=3225 RepID=A0A8T0HZH3_CERPU|nr:hypothetical protein KC19_5G061100 [Ceratodon purpureus]KAG0615747.1 hypothetical protein M758_5G063400 [Ceratodon purpureus]